VRTLILVSLGSMAACAGDPAPASDTGSLQTTPEPTVDLAALGERGPHGAGSRALDITGSTGTPLTLQLWYPTAIPDADLLYDGIIPGRAALNAEVLCDEVRGLVAFSHGNGGTRLQSPFLTEHLASHGWAVVAPDHTGNTVFDPSAPFGEILVRRPVDVADSVDAAFAELAGCLDEAEGYVVAGHSFGGYTALAVAGATVNDLTGASVDLSDPRVRGAVGLAPWDAFGAITDGAAEIEVPTLVLTGARDETTPLAQVERLYEPLTVDPRWLGTLLDGGHFTFSPIACSLEDGDGCGESYVPLEVATALVNASVTALVEGIRGTDGAFDAVAVDSPELSWESAR
jgi:predicted dienelactone hydrolase